jgi:hypothetical protein
LTWDTAPTPSDAVPLLGLDGSAVSSAWHGCTLPAPIRAVMMQQSKPDLVLVMFVSYR